MRTKITIHFVYGFPTLLVCLLVTLFSINTFAQTACDFEEDENIILVNTGNATGGDLVTTYVLTDSGGNILATSAIPEFDPLAAGSYSVHVVNYDSGEASPDLSVGANINDIGTNCIDTESLDIQVCFPAPLRTNCHFIEGVNFSLTHTGQMTGADVITEYVLTDLDGVILQRNSTPDFTGMAAGNYLVYAVNYDVNSASPDLGVRENIADIGTDCIDTTVLPVDICACATGTELGDTEIEFILTGQTNDPSYTQTFVLTDGQGVILGIYPNSAPVITNLDNTNKVYDVYSLVYETSTPPSGIDPGDAIDDIALGGCDALSQPLGFTLCPLLPIDLIAFKGIEQDCKVLLTWETANEIDISHFNIQESTDGIGFIGIGRIDANGGPDYGFIDDQLLTTNYYRLEIVGTDGKIEYSETLSVDSKCAGDISTIDIYPNPVKAGLVYINFTSNGIDHEAGKIVITDVLSRRIMEVPITVIFGTNQVSIDPSRLPAAPYLLHLEGEQWRSSIYKFIKITDK